MASVPWHMAPAPAAGHLAARRGAQLAALLYALATLVYLAAWNLREVASLCFQRDDGPPCPPPPAEWLTGVCVAAWTIGALLVLAALGFAGRATAGQSSASSVWRLLAAAVAAGVVFSALVLATR